jgi:2,4-dienoyl-CoA reductase-like NADH-dependent reductase (Old Yellow Enzyme family)/thioredoxin reductase
LKGFWGMFEKLFTPGKIGPIEVRNRIIMSSMLTNFAHATGEPSLQMIDYYAERAKGGAGLLVVEGASFTYPVGVLTASRLRIDSENHISKHYELVEAVHSYGAKIILQFLHAGGKGRTLYSAGHQPVSPSGIGRVGLPPPRALTTEEVEQMIHDMVGGADRAKRAGYDGIELNVGHGYLFHEFLCESTNVRTDRYGGSLENRARIIIEAIQSVKSSLKKDFAVMIRLSGEGGYDIGEGKIFARLFEQAGADAIDVSGGGIEPYPLLTPETNLMDLTPGWLVPYAQAIKDVVHIPIVTVGEIKDPEFAEAILIAGKADFIALGRALLSDPDWPRKAAEGKEREIRKCISCDTCKLSTAGGSKAHANRPALGIPLRCAINAAAGREKELSRIRCAKTRKRVMIVGGGPAGMEAARTAALRGHTVSLYERAASLGGQLNVAAVPPGKKKIHWVTEFLEGQLNKLKVRVYLNREVKAEEVIKEAPEVLIVATGSKPVMPDIPGINNHNVVTACDILSGTGEAKGTRVVIVGAGQTGCETAEFLAEKGFAVTLIDKLPYQEIALDAIPDHRNPLLARLNSRGVRIHTEQALKEVKDNGIVVETIQGERKIFEADAVVIAAGTDSLKEIAEQVKEKVPEIYVVGDGAGNRRIADAIYGGAIKASRM